MELEESSVFEAEIKEEPEAAQKPSDEDAAMQEAIFASMGQPIVTNTSNQDVVVDIKIDGNNLEQAREQIMRLAPHMGFEVEKAEIITKKSETDQPQDLNESHLSSEVMGEIEKMVEDKVQQKLNESLENLELNYPEQVKKCNAVHHGITCDKCGVHPIRGIRYKSLTKQDYDLCSKCEASADSSDTFIRFR